MRRNRGNFEFLESTKIKIVELKDGKCECCGRKLKEEEYTFHHILAVWYAEIFFPNLSYLVIRHIRNCQLLCSSCHDKIHYQEVPKIRYTPHVHKYRQQAKLLSNIML